MEVSVFSQCLRGGWHFTVGVQHAYISLIYTHAQRTILNSQNLWLCYITFYVSH